MEILEMNESSVSALFILYTFENIFEFYISSYSFASRSPKFMQNRTNN